MTGIQRSAVPAEFQPLPKSASPGQIKYLEDLIETRSMTDAQRAEARVRLAQGLTMAQASAWIEKALSLPKADSKFAKELLKMPEVPDGKYALRNDVPGEEPIKFYKVSNGTDLRPAGKDWRGFVFLDVIAGPEEHSIKNLDAKRWILARIAEDPAEASALYGHEIGRCGVCGRRLTREESRERGIGPICAENLGW